MTGPSKKTPSWPRKSEIAVGRVVGEVEAFYRFDDGRELSLFHRRNLVVDTGMDLLAKSIAGRDFFIDGMYFAFTNSPGSSIPFDPVTVDRTVDHYHTVASLSPFGVVRAATIAEPKFSTSDNTKFNHNQVTFVSITGSEVINPDTAADLTDGVSKFYGMGLVHLDQTDFRNDILFAALNFDDFIDKIANAQVGFRWKLTFKTPEP